MSYDPDESTLEDEIEEEIDSIRGTISSGTCYYCGESDGMVNVDDICFVCKHCNNSMTADLYYRYYLGYPVETDYQ